MADIKVNPQDPLKISNEPVYTPDPKKVDINKPQITPSDPLKISNEPVYKPNKK